MTHQHYFTNEMYSFQQNDSQSQSKMETKSEYITKTEGKIIKMTLNTTENCFFSAGHSFFT